MLRFRNMRMFFSDIVQDPIDKFRGVRGAVGFSDLNSLVDRGCRINIVEIEDLISCTSQDREIDDRHSVEFPIFGCVLKDCINRFQMCRRAFNEFQGEGAEFYRCVLALPKSFRNNWHGSGGELNLIQYLYCDDARSPTKRHVFNLPCGDF